MSASLVVNQEIKMLPENVIPSLFAVMDVFVLMDIRPLEIFLELSQDNQSLEVLRLKDTHNTMVNRELYEYLPKQRALHQDLMNEDKEVITLKANSKLLQQNIETSSGKTFTLKDIEKLRQYLKVSFSGSEIKNIAEF